MERIFIMNLGTTSFKFKLYAFDDQTEFCLASGEIESVGASSGYYELVGETGEKLCGRLCCKDHEMAFSFCLNMLKQMGILKGMEFLDAVGYKAVHGGKRSETCLVDDELLEEMEKMIPLAPAHNPVYLKVMKAIHARYPELLQVAHFEVSFHASIPEYRAAYGIPDSWREDAGIRKYGFHGSSHEYIAEAIRERSPETKRLISCHLGGSSSLCAILDGKSIATTMGATPQSGLFHNNRVGDFDVFCIPMLMKHYGYTFEQILHMLSSESGILGLSGVSNDLRKVLNAALEGNTRAKLTVDALEDNIVGYIGMLTAYLGGLDALVFTGGIGFNSSLIRTRVCRRLGWLGISLDETTNEMLGEGQINDGNSKISVWKLKTNEELVVARNVRKVLCSI